MNKHETLVKHSKYESGQAIVIIALVIVGLLGMLGLAVDGGGLFLLSRNVQNATDAAVVAASYALCTGTDPVQAAEDAAGRNGFVNGENGVRLVVNNPPVNGTKVGNPDYVEIDITADKPAYFIQLVYRGPLRVTNRAVGYCRPPLNPATLPPLWAGSQTCQNTIDWSGSSGYLEGGMHSNHEIKFTGSGTTVRGPVNAVTTVQTGNAGNVTYLPTGNTPVTGVDVQDEPLAIRISDFAPGGEYALRADLYRHITATTVPAGLGSWRASSNTWTLNGVNAVLEGLYYVEGNVDMGNGLRFGPRGVTIVATGAINGSATNMRYYDRAPGIMFYSSYTPNPGDPQACNDKGIDIQGSGSTWYGVIYAPRSGVNISGSNNRIYGAIIANTINISASRLELIYRPEFIPPRAPLVQIAE